MRSATGSDCRSTTLGVNKAYQHFHRPSGSFGLGIIPQETIALAFEDFDVQVAVLLVVGGDEVLAILDRMAVIDAGLDVHDRWAHHLVPALHRNQRIAVGHGLFGA